MKLLINIEDNIFNQFSEQLNAKESGNSMFFESEMGKGQFNTLSFPNDLHFYHFTFNLNHPIEVNSFNSSDSEYLLMNINLSEREVKKEVNGEEINFQKYLPSGILFYPPNIKVYSKTPVNTDFEIVLIKFHKDLLKQYFEKNQLTINSLDGSPIYEDLDSKSEELLNRVISSDNRLDSHANVLAFLSIFYNKLNERENELKHINLHPQDIKQLFISASFLRNPRSQNVPTIDELAKIANMGKTKFKNSFKQVFGKAPKQYHQKIKMEYAKEALLNKEKKSNEIAYELGYSDPSKFSRAFKNHFGESPSNI